MIISPLAVVVVSFATVCAHLATRMASEPNNHLCVRFISPPPERRWNGIILIRLLLDLKRSQPSDVDDNACAATLQLPVTGKSLVSLIMRERNSATCDLLINCAPILTFNLSITVAVCPAQWPLYALLGGAPPRLLATFEEWADPRCQTNLERCAIVLPCRGRLTPPARGMTLPASHASTLPLHVLSHHSTNIVSVAANFFRPHTKEG